MSAAGTAARKREMAQPPRCAMHSFVFSKIRCRDDISVRASAAARKRKPVNFPFCCSA